ncbi:MAG: hypothetical protein NTW66_00775 [Candidatus Magasanikbacteria bacterium]|nr:hypothetical protein [Candidatus Magasanikbacteria bacterium]
MTTLRSRLFIFISLIVLIILGISVGIIVFVRQKAAPPVEQPPAEDQTGQIDSTNFPVQITPPPVVVPTGIPVKPLTTEEALKNGAKQMAKIFTERYGTYSSDSDFANIREVETLVTMSYWSELEKKIGTGKPAVFLGVTTNAVASDVVEYASGKAMVEVSAQRITTKGSSTTQTNEKAKVWLVETKGIWLVDKFEWVK